MKTVHGIIAVLVTHFKSNMEIDYDSASAHVDRMLKAGVHALLPLGATGEFSSLSLNERKAYAEFFMKEVKGRAPVIIGAVSQNLDDTMALGRHAAKIGADGIMVLPCPGLHLNQEEIYRLYEQVSRNVPLPLMIYNNPGSSGVDILPETLQKISKLPNVAYLKDSTANIMRLTRAVDEIGNKTSVLCGCENLAYESLVMGARGWVCVAANVAPAMTVELYDLIVNKKDLAAARNVYRKLLPLLRLIEDTGELWQVVKYALARQGVGSGALRPPRLPISAGVKAGLDRAFAEENFQ